VAVVVEPVAAPEVAVVVEPVAASVAGVVSAAPEVKAEEQQKPCVACKEAIPTDDRFCMHCGAEQVAAAEVVAPEFDTSPPFSRHFEGWGLYESKTSECLP
jgi:predicted transcriptional regulator